MTYIKTNLKLFTDLVNVSFYNVWEQSFEIDILLEYVRLVKLNSNKLGFSCPNKGNIMSLLI